MTSWADLVTTEPPAGAPEAAVDAALNQRISVCHARLESVAVDALVLPTDAALTHTSALAMRVSRAAGPAFAKECGRLGKLALGQAASTQGHQLPARLVVHTVLPRFNPAFRAACATALADSVTASLGALLGATPLPASVLLPCLHPEEQGWPQVRPNPSPDRNPNPNPNPHPNPNPDPNPPTRHLPGAGGRDPLRAAVPRGAEELAHLCLLRRGRGGEARGRVGGGGGFGEGQGSG